MGLGNLSGMAAPGLELNFGMGEIERELAELSGTD